MSSYYCQSIVPVECVSYSISLLPDFGFVFSDVLWWMTDADKTYNAMHATCNDILGKPDGECFVNAFENCEYASIKNMHSTVEGNLVYSEAHIEIDGTCSITYAVFDQDSKWRDTTVSPVSVRMCTNVQLNNEQIFLQCDGEPYVFPLQ
ncbi:MAG: hypothetical protein K5798_10015 [Nitrosopumilus sp.]|uniref:hypothetical protein n=1 Tax=Nitrosopumilus sp. TaxID=2024843 RepID=UPI00242BA264|nr:hypothetical protein [Nitrosopumilus sp.]MCV0367579.1 hypothetical protein [Nitrosopumilus sp.]